MTTSDRGPAAAPGSTKKETERQEPAGPVASKDRRPIVIEPRLVLAVLLAAIGIFLQIMVWVSAAYLSEATEWAWAMVVGSLLCAAAFVAVGVLLSNRVLRKRKDIEGSVYRPSPERRSTIADRRP